MIAWMDTTGIGRLDSNPCCCMGHLKYSITNHSEKSIYFLDISISKWVYDSTGTNKGLGFWLHIQDSSAETLYNMEHAYDFRPNEFCYNRGLDIDVIPLNGADTNEHIVLIKPGETYTNLLRMYGCSLKSFDTEPKDLDTIKYKYAVSLMDRKMIRFFLSYDNTGLTKNILYGKKVWRGKLKAPTFTEETTTPTR